MISMDKKYRTVKGNEVRILCVDGPSEDYPVIGIVGDNVVEWTKTGNYQKGLSSVKDLIEVKPKKMRCINYYGKEFRVGADWHESKESAGCCSSNKRTHIIILEQEEGCEPTVRIEKV